MKTPSSDELIVLRPDEEGPVPLPPNAPAMTLEERLRRCPWTDPRRPAEERRRLLEAAPGGEVERGV